MCEFFKEISKQCPATWEARINNRNCESYQQPSNGIPLINQIFEIWGFHLQTLKASLFTPLIFLLENLIDQEFIGVQYRTKRICRRFLFHGNANLTPNIGILNPLRKKAKDGAFCCYYLLHQTTSERRASFSFSFLQHSVCTNKP